MRNRKNVGTNIDLDLDTKKLIEASSKKLVEGRDKEKSR